MNITDIYISNMPNKRNLIIKSTTTNILKSEFISDQIKYGPEILHQVNKKNISNNYPAIIF